MANTKQDWRRNRVPYYGYNRGYGYDFSYRFDPYYGYYNPNESYRGGYREPRERGGEPFYYGYGFPWDYYGYKQDYELNDEEIAEMVRSSIDEDMHIPRSDKERINISVDKGVVTLSGIVQNRRSKPLAYADAFRVRGVTDVNTRIKIMKRRQKLSKL